MEISKPNFPCPSENHTNPTISPKYQNPFTLYHPSTILHLPLPQTTRNSYFTHQKKKSLLLAPPPSPKLAHSSHRCSSIMGGCASKPKDLEITREPPVEAPAATKPTVPEPVAQEKNNDGGESKKEEPLVDISEPKEEGGNSTEPKVAAAAAEPVSADDAAKNVTEKPTENKAEAGDKKPEEKVEAIKENKETTKEEKVEVIKENKETAKEEKVETIKENKETAKEEKVEAKTESLSSAPAESQDKSAAPIVTVG